MSNSQEPTLAGKSLLVVEENPSAAREIRAKLTEKGARVIGPAPTAFYARLIVGRRNFDGAILSAHLLGEEMCELADMLIERGVPIIFATDGEQTAIRSRYRQAEMIERPLDINSLIGKAAALQPISRPCEKANVLPPPPVAEVFRTQQPMSMQETFARAVARAIRQRF